MNSSTSIDFAQLFGKLNRGFHSKNLDTRVDYYGGIGNTFTSILIIGTKFEHFGTMITSVLDMH